jgi:hypothetical protein
MPVLLMRMGLERTLHGAHLPDIIELISVYPQDFDGNLSPIENSGVDIRKVAPDGVGCRLNDVLGNSAGGGYQIRLPTEASQAAHALRV